MAFNCKAGTFAIPGSTGNQSVTGVGFQPKVVLFFFSPNSSDGASVDWQHLIGAGISSSSRRAFCTSSNDGAATTATSAFMRADGCIDQFADGALSVSLGRADFVSQDADGFTLNWVAAPGSGTICYLALGGDDLTNVFLGTIVTPGSTGEEAYTGVGFQPDCTLIFGNDVSTGRHLACLGAAVSATERWSIAWNSETGQATSRTMSMERSDLCLSMVFNEATLVEADFVSHDADGFTLDFDKISGSRDYFVLCLKGGQYAAGVDTQKTSTGTKATTGVGFTPKGLLFASANMAAGTSVVQQQRLTIGGASGATSRWSVWSGDADNQADSICDNDLDTAACLKMLTEGTPTLDAEADLDSFDSDGFTLDWGTADATAREFAYLAFGDAAAGGGGAAPTHVRRRGANLGRELGRVA